MFGMESKLEKKCCAYAKQNGWLGIKLTSASHNGRFDRVFMRGFPKLRVVFVEFKAPGGRPTALQLAEFQHLGDMSLEAYFCDDFEDFKSYLSD